MFLTITALAAMVVVAQVANSNPTAPDEDFVTCGGHRAPTCADCYLRTGSREYGASWCRGECKWNAATSTCIFVCMDNFEYCHTAKLDCEQEFVKKNCKKHCNLCPKVCNDNGSWCELGKPDCSTKPAQENCAKYCGLC